MTTEPTPSPTGEPQPRPFTDALTFDPGVPHPRTSAELLDRAAGQATITALFPADIDRIACPFPAAPRLRDEVSPGRRFTAAFVASDAHLTWLDPRELYGSQSWILRQHVDYYLHGYYERSGRPSAEDDRRNHFPAVVEDPRGRRVIVAGHHRAAAALLRGQMLRCRFLPALTAAAGVELPADLPVADTAVAIAPQILWGEESVFPHVVARTAPRIVTAVLDGQRVVCPDREQAELAARWLGSGQTLFCTTCGGLQNDRCTPVDRRDSCRCRPPLDPANELGHEEAMSCFLCQSCLLVPVTGHIRWRLVVCARCRPRTDAVNTALGKVVLPRGIHSLVNETAMAGASVMLTKREAAALADEITTMFDAITRFKDWSHEVMADRLRALGLEPGGTIPLDHYREACAAAGVTPDTGFDALLDRLAIDIPLLAALADRSRRAEFGIPEYVESATEP